MGGQFFGGGSGGGGGAPTGAAGGDLSGTYPNPGVANLNGVAAASYALLAGPTFTGTVTLPASTVTSGMILDGTIVSGDLNAAAGITSGQLAGSIAPSKITGTAVTAADTGTVTSAMISDATIVSADLSATAGITSGQLAGSIAPSKITGTAVTAADTGTVTSAMILDGTIVGGDLNSTIAIPSTATATTPAANTNTTALATSAYAVAQDKLNGGSYQFGPGCFSNIPYNVAGSQIAAPNAGDGRWARVVMAQSGTLHDVSCLVNTTGGNYNILVLDDGQANATHTTRTCLGLKGSTATPVASAYITYDVNIAVNAGDTLVFMLTFDGTTAKAASSVGSLGGIALPNSSWFPGSGASTANSKICGTLLSASVPTTTSGAGSTVTDANMVQAANTYMFMWRIS